jgi:predicted Fe-Mo cluster-binding NifX family protein
MMKVAIPIFLDRISPRLDCARKLLVLEIEKDHLVDKREVDISHWAPDEKIFYLSKIGISQLICGGIRIEDRSGLHRFGIQVASPLYGEVDTIIKEYLSGKLNVSCHQVRQRKGRRRRCI